MSTSFRWIPLFIAVLTGGAGIPISSAPQEPVLRVEPTQGQAGEYGTWTVVYRVGAGGIRQGGGLRVQLPDTWHAGDRNSANRLQASDPRADHYVSARSSNPAVRLRTEVESESSQYLVKSGRPSLDGRAERYVYVVRVTVESGHLQPGDTLSVIYGDRSGGSRGMRAAVVSTSPEPVLAAVDRDGSGRFTLLQERPTLESRPGPAGELQMIVPSTLVVGIPAHIRLSVVDRHANPATDFAGPVELKVVQGSAEVPSTVPFKAGRGWQTVQLIPRQSGILRLEARALDEIFISRGNPAQVFASEPERRLYWGDLHSHTHYSWDGVGHDAFEYARHIAGLDFYAMTDHSLGTEDGFTRGLGPHVWDEYTALTDRHHAPGKFVTLHAYEASFSAPFGHHNVFFRGKPGALLIPGVVTLPQLWEALTAGEALTIPHHTGKMPAGVQWAPHDPERRRNLEIYSGHGLSEAYDPAHPLAFEQSNFTSPARSVRGKGYAQDAWAAGLVLSTIGASDDHRSRPGQPHWGLAAVCAAGLTREQIFDGLYERRTYATTGARILLEFSVNGAEMGQEVTVQDSPILSVEAHGTGTIDWVEILRYDATAGSFQVIYSLRPEALDLAWSHHDPGFREDSIYYVRLRQKDLVRDRVAMAWSTPIWVRKGQE